MLVLGIETSCDETAVALMSFSSAGIPTILTEEISSQAALHELYGGVVPELASREHLKNLPLLVEKVLGDSNVTLSELAGVAVTRGPGLQGCLLMGLCYAKGLAVSVGVPLVGVNHIEGHLLGPKLDNPELSFPYLGLVVSGGHTELHLVEGVGRYRVLARTTDDAAGEAFDKSANLLGLGYPGGAKLASLADTVSSSPFSLPKVMREAEGFSFSGLKTAVALLVRRNEGALCDPEKKAQIAYSVQDAIVDVLCYKLGRAIEAMGIRRVVVTGGVSANRCLRGRVSEIANVDVYFPTFSHSMDNAAMIAYVGGLRLGAGEGMPLDADVLSRWPVETMPPCEV